MAALEQLRSTSQDTATMATSTGLLCKLQDVRCIMSVMFLRRVFQVTGPVSRILQGTTADLSIVATLIDGCVQKLTTFRHDVDQFFKELKQEVTDFCKEHQINPKLQDRRIRKKKRMAGEQADDENIADTEQAYKVDVIINSLDVILQQLNDRFSGENVAFLREMKYVTPASLLSLNDITASDIQHLCKFYNLDASAVASERNAFAPIFKSLSHLIDVSDVSHSVIHDRCAAAASATDNSKFSLGNSDIHESGDNDDDFLPPTGEHCAQKWVNNTFLKPL
jgi:Sec-independent protein translocase protein TatA